MVPMRGMRILVVIIIATTMLITACGPTQYSLSTSVSPDGSGIIDPATGTYDAGTEVTLTTEPASGYRFDHWSGDAEGTYGTVTITMDEQKSVTAHFKAQYTLSTSVSPSGGGTVDHGTTTYDHGTEVTLTAEPASGYRFDYWSGHATGTSSSITITMDDDKSVTAHFFNITRQVVQSARRVYLEINQTNQEVEPRFSETLADYITFLLTYHSLAIAEPGDKYDISLIFNLTAWPRGAEYRGADDLCYTGASISGEVVVTASQGESLQYDFDGSVPIYQGIITYCPTKAHAPFDNVYEPETLSIFADLWGVPMCVYACVWRVEFLSKGHNSEGKPSVEPHDWLINKAIPILEALGTEAVPPLIALLSSDDGQIRWAVMEILWRIDVDTTQAIPYLIECLHDPFVLEAYRKEYHDDLYPVRESALNSLTVITGQDFGYDEDQWQKWWQANRPD